MPMQMDFCQVCHKQFPMMHVEVYKRKVACISCREKLDSPPQWLASVDAEYKRQLFSTIRRS